MKPPETPNTEIVAFSTEPMEIDYWEESNPYSVLKLVETFKEGRLAELMLENRESLEYLLRLDEDHLRKIVKPTHDNNHLRLRFWAEYDLAQKSDCPMNFRRVCDGIVSPEGFYVQVCSLGKLAWILRPPKDYMESIEEALSSGVSRMREIMDAEIRNEDGSYNTAVMNSIIRAFTTLDNRVKGLPTKTILKKSLSVNVQKSTKELPRNTGAIDVTPTEEEILDQELQNAQQDLERIKYDPRVSLREEES